MRTRELSDLDLQRAIRLRAEGKRWRAIGIMLAAEKGRPSPFQEDSIAWAVTLYVRRVQTTVT